MSVQHATMDVTQPEFLHFAGHPLRWRLLGELARSDRTLHERYPAFPRTAAELETRIGFLLAVLTNGTTAP